MTSGEATIAAGPATRLDGGLAAAAAERRFRAMNTDVHIVVLAERDHAALLDRAEQAVHDHEARWSRFLPDSEISRLNAAGGRPVIVSADTYALVAKAIDAWHLTGGAFDPTVGACLIAAGYDRSFEKLAPGENAHRPPAEPGPAATPRGIELHHATSAVVAPPGVTIDLGGIAKGQSAETIVADLLAAGAVGCCVNIGGDLRVAGLAPEPRGWTVTLDCPGSSEVRAIALADGAVCTSTTTKRAWIAGGRPEHHLRDPGTGAPLATGLASVSVVAARGDQAEVLTKAALAAGRDGAPRVLTAAGATGVLVTSGGAVVELDGFDRFRLGVTDEPDPSRPSPLADRPGSDRP